MSKLSVFVIFAIISITLIQKSIQELSILSNTDRRIIGGREVDINQVPYIVSISYNRNRWQHRCGGSIYKPNIIISAAHCFRGVPAIQLLVRAGSPITSYGGQERSVKEIILNPEYNPFTIDKDIAILVLNEPLTYSSTVRNIELHNQNETISDGSIVTTAGWGVLRENAYWTKNIKLRAVNLEFVTREKCNRYLRGEITENMLCAGDGFSGRRDACQGDSGGPLVQNGKLIGITSWGYGCARRLPGVYTDVAAMRNWIDSTV